VDLSSQVGPQNNTAGSSAKLLRSGRTGELSVAEAHGRFYEPAYWQTLFSIGMGANALSANTITLVATTTPILGVWNPANSPVNLVIAQAAVQVYANTLITPAGCGPFVWAASTGNAGITTGLSPFNRKSMAYSGSQAKGFTPAVALTGLTNNLVVFDGADFTNPTILACGTIVAPTAGTSLTSFGGVQNFDGSLLVPPGGVLVLLNTTSTTTMSVAGRLLWEEVPI
jgi:hypothetical protein